MGSGRGARLEAVADDVESVARQIGASGATMIVRRNGETLLERYAGAHHHLPGARPIAADSRFNVYSVRKTYIGLAAALALYDGRPPQTLAGTTIRHLVTRCRGLGGRGGQPVPTDWQGSNLAVQVLCRLV